MQGHHPRRPVTGKLPRPQQKKLFAEESMFFRCTITSVLSGSLCLTSGRHGDSSEFGNNEAELMVWSRSIASAMTTWGGCREAGHG